MVIYCFIEDCKSTRYKRKHDENHNNETFYGFPTNPDLREKWIKAIITLNKQESKRKIFKYSKICKLHFSDDCFEQFGFSHIRLKPNAIPSQFPRMQNKNLNKSIIQNDLSEEIIKSSAKINMDNSQEVNLVKEIDSNNSLEFAKNVESINSMTPKTTFMDRFETENIESKVEHDSPECIDICKTPTKKILRYPGDIKENGMKDMTPRTVIRSMKLLKQACVKKNNTIKRLRTEKSRRKKKIKSLQTLLMDLKQKCLLSSNSSDIVKVWSQKLNKFKF